MCEKLFQHYAQINADSDFQYIQYKFVQDQLMIRKDRKIRENYLLIYNPFKELAASGVAQRAKTGATCLTCSKITPSINSVKFSKNLLILPKSKTILGFRYMIMLQ